MLHIFNKFKIASALSLSIFALSPQVSNATTHSSCNGGSQSSTASAICEGDVWWDFRTSNNTYASTVTGGTYEYTSEDTTNTQVTISGWSESNSNGGGTLTNASNQLVHWGQNGLGIYESNSPNHAVDSSGADEFILFTFEEEVSLICYSFGWPDANGGVDYDSTLGYWDGSGSNTPDPAGLTIGQLGSEGWKLAGEYTNNPQDYTIVNNDARLDASADTVDQEIYSRYWIVGAYMTQFPGSTLGSNYAGNDYFKLASVSVVTRPNTPPPPGGEVPTPAPLALMAAGLFLLRKKFV